VGDELADRVLGQRLLPAEQRQARGEALEVPGEAAQVGLVEVVDVEDEPAVGVEVGPEVLHVQVTVDPDPLRTVARPVVGLGRHVVVEQARGAAVEGVRVARHLAVLGPERGRIGPHQRGEGVAEDLHDDGRAILAAVVLRVTGHVRTVGRPASLLVRCGRIGSMATTQLGDTTVSTVGELPAVGSKAPGFELVDAKFQPLTDSSVDGKRVVLNIFPSIDTGVCQASVRKFNELASGLENTAVVCVSRDLPFAQARFCGAEGIDAVLVGSAFRSSFGADYGVAIDGGGWDQLFARAVVVLDADGTVLHTQLTDAIGDEPDYDAAVAALS
jgi:thioredoxin-dependent peroxiredoxin